MEERGTREGSQEKPPPFPFRGCVALETPALAKQERCAWADGYILTTFPLCFCVPSCVWVGGGMSAGLLNKLTYFYFSWTLLGEQER